VLPRFCCNDPPSEVMRYARGKAAVVPQSSRASLQSIAAVIVQHVRMHHEIEAGALANPVD
jgi:hypothetical protein